LINNKKDINKTKALDMNGEVDEQGGIRQGSGFVSGLQVGSIG
jgi:hypothetical protein